MRRIQQLVYDGKRLFCLDHPNQQLEEGMTSSERGSFTIFCRAAVPPSGNCMNSAEWPSRKHMIDELFVGN